MSTTQTLPTGSHNQAGQTSQPNIESDEWSGVEYLDVTIHGRIYRLWKDGRRHFAQAMHTGAVRAFKTWAERNGFMWRLQEHLARKLKQTPPVVSMTVVVSGGKRLANGLHQSSDDLLQKYIDKAAGQNGREPSKREQRYEFKRRVVNRVVRRVHLGIDTPADWTDLKMLEGPIPAADPIDQDSEYRIISDALIDTHKCAPTWESAPGFFRWATQRRYGIKEGPDGHIVLMNGRSGPQAIVGRVHRNRGKRHVHRPGMWDPKDRSTLRRAIRKFVEEVHPDLPPVVEGVKDEVPF